jgi:polygalacturonase
MSGWASARWWRSGLTGALLYVSAAMPLGAQDTRTVSEPKTPDVCVTLRPLLAVEKGMLTDAEEMQPDTLRIQAALDHCEPGKAVELASSDAGMVFLSGPLRLRTGVTLLVAKGAVLVGSRNPRDYDETPGSCGVVDTTGHGCKPLLLAQNAPGAAVMGEGAVDGRGGAMLVGQRDSWWDLAQVAKVRDLRQNCPRLLVVRRSNGFVLYQVTLRNAPNFHVSVEETDGFTAWSVRIDTPATARNTDGIDPSSSTNVTIAHSFIRDGDDDVAIKAGDNGPSTHMSVVDDHFYSGHGMSIGSETNGGVSDVLVKDISIDGADNGIRIKSDASRGGLVQRVVYEDVCMRGVKNPIVLTPHYSDRTGDLLPVYRDVMLRNVHILSPGKYALEGLDAGHVLGLALDNVTTDALPQSPMEAEYVEETLGPEIGNVRPAGKDVLIQRLTGSIAANPFACPEFPKFPMGW